MPLLIYFTVGIRLWANGACVNGWGSEVGWRGMCDDGGMMMRS